MRDWPCAESGGFPASDVRRGGELNAYRLAEWWRRHGLQAGDDADALHAVTEALRNLLQLARVALERVDEVVAHAARPARRAGERDIGDLGQQRRERRDRRPVVRRAEEDDAGDGLLDAAVVV